MRRDQKHILYHLNETETSYRGLWLLCILYFGSLLAGAALSLVAFKLTHALDPDSSSYLANKPFTRFFDRARWVSVLIILPFLFRSCRLTTRAAIGFAPPRLATFSKWFAYGIFMILLIYISNTLMGAFAFEPQWRELAEVDAIGTALVGALLIGILEEVVFRGLVFRMFYTAFQPVVAIVLSSLFFAILHFKPSSPESRQLDPSEVGLGEALGSAWETIAALVTRFDLAYLLTIFLVGVVLHQVFLLTRNLWASIGLHAGWVFTIKMISGSFTDSGSATALSGSTRLVDGYWVSIVLALFVLCFALLQRKRDAAITS